MALDGHVFTESGLAHQAWAPAATLKVERRPITIGPITIGLVNNMPDTALSATENQFRRLIQAAGGERDVRLKLFSIPEIVRSDAAREAMAGRYAATERLPTSGVDALIVTGAEPLAADLRAEPYWRSLAALVDWAEANTISTLWSCLAAHAAVLRLDGVVRKPLPAKCSGVFAVTPAANHALLSGRSTPMLVPHSRLNGLDEAELVAAGYSILTRSDKIGVDAFVREQTGSLFLFLQGHPEYDADSIALEYRRDVRRFLRGERASHPTPPTGYFDAVTEGRLAALAAETAQRPRLAALSECAKLIAAAPPAHTWAATTAQLYHNWLNLISMRSEVSIEA